MYWVGSSPTLSVFQWKKEKSGNVGVTSTSTATLATFGGWKEELGKRLVATQYPIQKDNWKVFKVGCRRTSKAHLKIHGDFKLF
jgi:hypothetical protein